MIPRLSLHRRYAIELLMLAASIWVLAAAVRGNSPQSTKNVQPAWVSGVRGQVQAQYNKRARNHGLSPPTPPEIRRELIQTGHRLLKEPCVDWSLMWLLMQALNGQSFDGDLSLVRAVLDYPRPEIVSDSQILALIQALQVLGYQDSPESANLAMHYARAEGWGETEFRAGQNTRFSQLQDARDCRSRLQSIAIGAFVQCSLPEKSLPILSQLLSECDANSPEAKALRLYMEEARLGKREVYPNPF